MCFSSVYQEVDQGIPLSLHIFLHFSSFSSSILVTSSDIALNTYALFCICLIMVQGIMLYANVIQKILLKEWGSGQQPTLAAEPQCLSPLSMGKQCPHFWKKSIAVLNSQKKKKKEDKYYNSMNVNYYIILNICEWFIYLCYRKL